MSSPRLLLLEFFDITTCSAVDCFQFSVLVATKLGKARPSSASWLRLGLKLPEKRIRGLANFSSCRAFWSGRVSSKSHSTMWHLLQSAPYPHSGIAGLGAWRLTGSFRRRDVAVTSFALLRYRKDDARAGCSRDPRFVSDGNGNRSGTSSTEQIVGAISPIVPWGVNCFPTQLENSASGGSL